MFLIFVLGPPSLRIGSTSPLAIRENTRTLSSPESTINSSCATSTYNVSGCTSRVFGPAWKRQHRAPERHRHDDLVVLRVVEDAVHRPADSCRLAGNHARRLGISVCQPGKRRDPRLAYSIRDE